MRRTHNILGNWVARDDYDDGARIAGVDAPFFSKWEPGKNRGSVRFEPSFDLSNGAAQDAFIKFCDDLDKEDCIMPGANDPLPMCSRAPFKLTSTGTTKCFLREWKVERGSLPTGDVFDNELHAWLESSGGKWKAAKVHEQHLPDTVVDPAPAPALGRGENPAAKPSKLEKNWAKVRHASRVQSSEFIRARKEANRLG